MLPTELVWEVAKTHPLDVPWSLHHGNHVTAHCRIRDIKRELETDWSIGQAQRAIVPTCQITMIPVVIEIDFDVVVRIGDGVSENPWSEHIDVPSPIVTQDVVLDGVTLDAAWFVVFGDETDGERIEKQFVFHGDMYVAAYISETGEQTLMALVTPNAGELELLDRMLKDALSTNENTIMRLYSNDYTPSQTTVTGDFVECTFGGYAARTLTRSLWNAAVTVSNKAEASYGTTSVAWTASNSQVCYGYYMVGSNSSVTLWAERFSTARALAADDVLSVVPKFTLNSEN